MSGNKQITLKEIARETGFHYTTVARALKNNPLINKETRRLIQKKAEDMGYRPDPMLKALVRYRHMNNPNKSTPTIAFLSHRGPLKKLREEGRGGWQYYKGTFDQAEQLGYKLDFFWYSEPGISDQRWSQILRTRNISMIITANFHSGFTRMSLDWDDFMAVKISPAPHYPPMNVVSCNQMQTVRSAFQALRNLGYRRIALIVDEKVDDRLGNMWSAGYLVEQQKIPVSERIPPHDMQGSTEPKDLEDFIRKNRVDAILSYVEEHLGFIREAGLKVPEEIGFANLNVEDPDAGVAGTMQSYYEVGRNAVNQVTKLFESNVRGFPVLPSITYLNSEWIDGMTVRKQKKKAKAST